MIDEVILNYVTEADTNEILIPFTGDLLNALRKAKYLFFEIYLKEAAGTEDVTTLQKLNFAIHNIKNNYAKTKVITDAKAVPVKGISYTAYARVCTHMPVLDTVFYVQTNYTVNAQNLGAVTGAAVVNCEKNYLFTEQDGFKINTDVPIGAGSYLKVISRY